MNRRASQVLLVGLIAVGCSKPPQDEYCIALNYLLEQSHIGFPEIRGSIIVAENDGTGLRRVPSSTSYWTSTLTLPAFEECRVFKTGRDTGFQCHAASASELEELADVYAEITERTKTCLVPPRWDHFVPQGVGLRRADFFANRGTGMGVGVFVVRSATPWIDRSGSGDLQLYLRLDKIPR